MDKLGNNVQDQFGNAIMGATVTIYEEGTTTKATLYEDDEATTKANPLTSGSDGQWECKLVAGTYDIVIAYAGLTKRWDSFSTPSVGPTSTTIGVDDTNFNRLLTTGDDTIQKALDAIDDRSVIGASNLVTPGTIVVVGASAGEVDESAISLSDYVSNAGTSTDNALARFDGATGKIVQDGPVVVDDNGGMTGVDSLRLNTTLLGSVPTAAGTLYFKDGDREVLSMPLGLGRPELNIGEEAWYNVKNESGALIPNGTPVASNGVNASGLTLIVKASAIDSDLNRRRSYLGLTTEDIADGATGKVTWRGDVNNIDGSSFATGDLLWVGTTAGTVQNTPPEWPADRIFVGRVKDNDASTGVIGVRPDHMFFDEGFDGCVIERQDVYIVNDGGTLYFETELIGGGDLRFQLGGYDYLLDCTGGTGTGGRARSDALTPGTSTTVQLNACWIELSSGVGVLKAGTDFPDSTTTPHARIGVAYIWSVAKHTTDGVALFQRYTDAKAHNNRGRESYTGERIRAIGAQWSSGVAPSVVVTPNAGSADNVVFSNASGKVYQFHLQDFSARNISTDGLWIANATGGSLSKYQKVTDCNALLQLADGTAITNGNRFTLVFWGAANKNSTDCKLFVNLATGVYASDSSAYSDPNNYADVSIPAEFKQTGFLIAAVPLKYTTAASGTWELVGTLLSKPDIIDLRGVPVGVRGSASGGQASSFSDAVFSIFDNVDSTKKLAFQVSGISTATTRTLTVPDVDVLITSFAATLLDDASSTAARTTLGLGTIATQAANSVDIDGGAIDGTAIGGTTPAAGAFTTLASSGTATISGTLQAASGDGRTDITATALEIGVGRSADGNALVDFHTAEGTYPDYTFRFIRNGGANGSTQIRHRGTGDFSIESQDGGTIKLSSSGGIVVGIDPGTGKAIRTSGEIRCQGVEIGNNVAYQAQESGGTLRNMMYITGSNVAVIAENVSGGAFVNNSLKVNSATMIATATSFTNGAGAASGTLTNAPTAGNPTKWVPIDDNGTTRHIPAW